MKKTILVDANIIIRFFLNDHPKLSPQAKILFFNAEKGQHKLYFDEVVVAEVVWTLSSFYKIKKIEICEKFKTILVQNWVVNPRKNLILDAFNYYKHYNLDYIDCWIIMASKSLRISLETFDNDLNKISVSPKNNLF